MMCVFVIATVYILQIYIAFRFRCSNRIASRKKKTKTYIMAYERIHIENLIRCYLIFIDVVSMFDVRCPCVLCMCSLICRERKATKQKKKS